VPLSLLGIDPAHEFAVLELGASREGEIAALADLVEPEIGVLTAVAPTHLEGFGTLEGIARTKGELLERLPAAGFAVLNGDDPLVRRLARRAPCRAILVGEEVHNDIVATRVKTNDRRLRFHVGSNEFQVPLVGRQHLTASLISIAVARELGLSDAEILAGLRACAPIPSRCEKLSIGGWTVIDDSYNASPASMLAACVMLRDWQDARRRVLVSGDMLELGEHAAEFHSQLGSLAGDCRFDLVLALGEQASAVTAAARRGGIEAGRLAACSSLETLCLVLDCWLEPGDVLLVKGSRGMQMERVIAHLRQRAIEQSGNTRDLNRAA
jgi:UDP-N-acetylmuramoyl-tripeptide--D-alanyl-D-alanine ligase